MTVAFLIAFLITVLVVGLVVWAAFYAIDLIPVPAPFGNIAKAIVILIAVLIIVQRSGLLAL